MAEEEKISKTGATPVAVGDVGAKGVVNRVAELQAVFVDLTDGHGQKKQSIGFLAKDGSLYLIKESAAYMPLQQAQSWVGKQVLEKLGRATAVPQASAEDNVAAG